MITLDEKAQAGVDAYLLRASLKGCPSINAEDVERDIREHIEHELQQAPQPVSRSELQRVLDRLGSPTQWVPEEEFPWWRKAIHRLGHGPEDWRLSYLSFMLLVAGMYPYWMGRRGGTSFWLVCLVASFCLSRAAVAHRGGSDQLQPGQKWLLYPSLVAVYAFLVFWLLIGPIIACFALAYEFQRKLDFDVFPMNRHDDWAYWPVASAFIFGLIGLWWLLVGLLCKFRLAPLRGLFRPFLDKPPGAGTIAFVILSLLVFLVALMLAFPGWYDFLSGMSIADTYG